MCTQRYQIISYNSHYLWPMQHVVITSILTTFALRKHLSLHTFWSTSNPQAENVGANHCFDEEPEVMFSRGLCDMYLHSAQSYKSCNPQVWSTCNDKDKLHLTIIFSLFILRLGIVTVPSSPRWVPFKMGFVKIDLIKNTLT